jgi:hypothetical protein
MSKGSLATLLSFLFIGGGVGMYFILRNKYCKPLDPLFEDEENVKLFQKFMDTKDSTWYKGGKIQDTSKFGKWDCRTNDAYRENAQTFCFFIQELGKKSKSTK